MEDFQDVSVDNNKLNSEKKSTNHEKATKTLFGNKGPSKIIFVLLVLIYLTALVFTSRLGRSQGATNLFGMTVPVTMFTGVLSSFANISIIMMVFLFGKLGFITALSIHIIHLPIIFFNMFVHHSATTIPGVFTGLLTLFAIIIIFWMSNKTKKYQKKLLDQTITDPLTGLPSRFACTEMMNRFIKKGEQFAIVSIDLNNFKALNDTMGHAVGDKVLVEIASRLKEITETSPVDKYDFVARLGGDDFCLLMRDYESDHDIIHNIQMYEAEIKKKITIDGYDYFMTANFGYAEYLLDADNESALYSCADAALHEIKRSNGANNILRFSKELLKTAKFLEMEKRLRIALHEDAIDFYLQPQFDKSHNLRGFEALARIKNDDGSIILPNDFIPVAEEIGVIDRVDMMVFRKAACFMGRFLKETGSDIILSSNISVKHLMKNNFIEEIQSVLEQSGIPPRNVEIEITESIMIESAEKALKCIDRIKSLGMTVAIDDFGTGYSSLSYLNKFPVNILKIDKSFIENLSTSESSKKYVEAIISMGHILNLKVVSEGVETIEQLETLKTIDCDYIQGYIWGTPLPPEEAVKIVGQ